MLSLAWDANWGWGLWGASGDLGAVRLTPVCHGGIWPFWGLGRGWIGLIMIASARHEVTLMQFAFICLAGIVPSPPLSHLPPVACFRLTNLTGPVGRHIGGTGCPVPHQCGCAGWCLYYPLGLFAVPLCCRPQWGPGNWRRLSCLCLAEHTGIQGFLVLVF